MEVVYTSESYAVTDDMVDAFRDAGYVIVRNLLCAEELKLVSKNVEMGEDYQKYKFMIKDAEGNESAQITWNFPGSDVTGMVARSHKVAATCAKLLGGEVYHYHSKLVIKQPRTGGQRAWHQDYGYWYHNGCLFPDMLTVFVAVDSVNRGNGCLQVLEGSHRAGRIDHKFTGGEQGADLGHVDHLSKVCQLKHVEMEAGDALFFHCNLLHKSDVNTSDGRRLAFLQAYNRASNDPVIDSHHPRYTPLQMVENSAILACDNYDNTEGKGFLDMANLPTLKSQVKASA